MKKILEGPSRRAGTIFQEIDTNFIEVCSSILRIAFPDLTLKGYAETKPLTPDLFDAYLVRENAIIWGAELQKNNVVYWNGIEWDLLPFLITEINAALQFLYFDADKVSLAPVEGLNASNMQSAIELITAALVLHGIVIPNPPYGSGSV